MAEHERQLNDDVGITDDGFADIVRPQSGTLTVLFTGTAHDVIPAPKTTSMGYKIMKTHIINESEEVDGVIQLELLVDDKSYVWSGPKDKWDDGFLSIAMKIMGQEPEIPDN